MQEYSLIPTSMLNRIIKVLEKVEPLVQREEKWISQEEAMRLLNCKERKLFQLRKEGKIRYKTSGGGRNSMIDKESVDEFNEQNSSL